MIKKKTRPTLSVYIISVAHGPGRCCVNSVRVINFYDVHTEVFVDYCVEIALRYCMVYHRISTHQLTNKSNHNTHI